MTTIVLDPGHGGTKMVGKSSPNNAKGPTGLLEKTVTLDIAKRMVPHLVNHGHHVVLTRKTDDNLGLADRAAAAKSLAAPVFLSIHLNGYNGSAQGTETLCHHTHSGQSADLCRAVQKRLVAATGLKDRNRGHPGDVKRQSLAVLNPAAHHAKTACCLTEISFMDVAAEEARLKTPAYLEAIAEALCAGICDYLEQIGLSKHLKSNDVGDTMEALGRAEPPAEVQTEPARTPLTDTASDSDLNDTGEQSPAVTLPHFIDEMNKLQADTAFPMADFQAWIATLKLRYFTADELLTMGPGNASGKCAGKNSCPPRELWQNIGETARMLDEIRHRLGAPCFINSAYRSPAYNSCIGGEHASLHMKFNAIDFRCTKGTAKTWHDVARAVRASNPKFLGGIGRYNTFIHIDTRGREANW